MYVRGLEFGWFLTKPLIRPRSLVRVHPGPPLVPFQIQNDGFFSQVPTNEWSSSRFLTSVFARRAGVSSSASRPPAGTPNPTWTAWSGPWPWPLSSRRSTRGRRHITTTHIEECLAYLQTRPRWFGERETTNPRQLSRGHINGQYRRLHRFFNWLVERDYVGTNPLHLIKPPRLDEKTVPVVSEDQMRDLLVLTDPALARTDANSLSILRR